MTLCVRIVDKQGQVLFECPVEEKERAYRYACEMEQIGQEVSLVSPGLPEILMSSLGASEDELKALRDEIQEEVNSHL